MRGVGRTAAVAAHQQLVAGSQAGSVPFLLPGLAALPNPSTREASRRNLQSPVVIVTCEKTSRWPLKEKAKSCEACRLRFFPSRPIIIFSMPIYEFHCEKCERDSEILVRSSDWKGNRAPALRLKEIVQEIFRVRLSPAPAAMTCPRVRTVAVVLLWRTLPRALFSGRAAFSRTRPQRTAPASRPPLDTNFARCHPGQIFHRPVGRVPL